MNLLVTDTILRKELIILASKRNIPVGTYVESTNLINLALRLDDIDRVLNQALDKIEDNPMCHRMEAGIPAILDEVCGNILSGVILTRFDQTEKVSVLCFLRIGSGKN